MRDVKSFKRNVVANGCAVLFLLPFAAVGVGAVCMMLWHISSCQSAKSWVEQPCTIVRVELKRNDETSRVDADYQYEFANQQFTGNRIWFGIGSDNVGSFQQKAFDELSSHQQQGRPFRCFVDPNNPSSSVLYRDMRVEMLLFEAAFALIFGGVGIGGLLGLTYVIRKARRMNDAREFRPTEPWTWDEATSDGTFLPQQLWIGLILFAVIWNVMSWPMLFMFLWKELQQGPSLAWLFLAFPIIGIGAAWMALRAVYHRIRFGRPLLTIRPWPMYVGEPFEGTIDFPNDRPNSPELVVELTVSQKSSLDNENSTTLYSENVTVPNSEFESQFRLHAKPGLPRTSLLNDEFGEQTAEWKIKVTGSDGPRDFEAIYLLPAFKRPASDSTSSSLVD